MWSLSGVRLVPDTNHNLVYKCSRRMLQSASVVLLKAFIRTDYNGLQNHKWKKPEGRFVWASFWKRCSWWKPWIWGEMKSEGKESGFDLQHTANSPAFREKWPSVDRGENWILTWDVRKSNGDQSNAGECSRWVGVLYLSMSLSTGFSKALVRSLQPWAFSICLSQYCCS